MRYGRTSRHRRPFEKKALTLDELIKEAVIAGLGLDEISDSTWGEAVLFIDAYNERKRREYQNLSVIADAQAYLTAAYLSSGTGEMQVYDIFPFWSQEEKDALTVERYKRMLLKNSG